MTLRSIWSQYIKLILTDWKGEIDSDTKSKRLQYPTFNNRTSREKINKETANLKNNLYLLIRALMSFMTAALS